MKSSIDRQTLGMSILALLVVGLIFLLFFSFDREPQDILLLGLAPNDAFYVDNQYQGSGQELCVPNVPQGRHTLRREEDNQTITIAVHDLNIEVLHPKNINVNEVARLTNCTENAQIDAWIKANNLNSFGDPHDTVYTGGTPLFNEQTGTSVDRYEYIRSKHPDRPWRSQ